MAESDSDSDGLFVLAQDEDPANEHFGGFLHCLNRMKRSSERQKQDTVKELMMESKKAADTKASKIYLRKAAAASRRSPNHRLQTEAELDQNISYLQQCSINATGVHFALQQSVINAQLQENLQQQLPTPEEESISDDLMETLQRSQAALSLATSVAKRVAAVEAKKQARRQRRVELAALYRRIEDLWQRKEQRDLNKTKTTDSHVMKLKRAKLREYEDKLDIVVHLIQSFTTGTSSEWGTFARYINVLKACELYFSDRQQANWDKISELLAPLQ